MNALNDAFFKAHPWLAKKACTRSSHWSTMAVLQCTGPYGTEHSKTIWRISVINAVLAGAGHQGSIT